MSIKIDLTIILFLLIFCITAQIEIYLLLMLFAFIHELGHLFVGLILGFKPEQVNITSIGMKMEFKPKIEEYNRRVYKGNTLAIKRCIIAMAGPLINFIIIFITLVFNEIGVFKTQLYIIIIYSNFLIGIFNLIPIYPLDGGKILKEILHIKFGLKKSYIYTYIISKITIILLTIIASFAILYVKNIWIIVILIYLWGLMLVERKKYYAKKKLMELVDIYEKRVI